MGNICDVAGMVHFNQNILINIIWCNLGKVTSPSAHTLAASILSLKIAEDEM